MDGIERGENKNAKETVMFNLSSARKIENYCEIIYIYIYIYIYTHKHYECNLSFFNYF